MQLFLTSHISSGYLLFDLNFVNTNLRSSHETSDFMIENVLENWQKYSNVSQDTKDFRFLCSSQWTNTQKTIVKVLVFIILHCFDFFLVDFEQVCALLEVICFFI